jgi:hypothetical protein
MKHDHRCYCGTATPNHKWGEAHAIGKCGCVRRMAVGTEIPKPAPPHSEMGFDMWEVSGAAITDYTLKHQRGYAQHPCGCWSHWCDSVNSIDA